MTEHAEITAMMSLALDGMLSAAERRTLEEHLGSCSTCSAEWGRWRQVDALFSSEPAAAPPAEFSARVMAGVQAQVKRRRRLTLSAWLVGGSLYVWAMAALALGLAGLLWVLSDPPVAAVLARVLTQTLSAVGLLAKALRLGLAGIMRQEVVALVMSYACIVAATLAMWVRLARRRGTQEPEEYVAA